ncbi:class I SAM-dependent methyltransferase [Catenuloplanes indicus]|uniref:SAM-dependent methyltransferase n=1 Tax=Catenuloplanes indicus TaxID=137267 RepID=A0AAE4AU78_9ACTN|nr:class I SAM-dependent methyltransferase [Catenuloplanes indicus]MDQ0363510.1 SAM-dependent methyltransferase [Catenuloplanes indicus]
MTSPTTTTTGSAVLPGATYGQTWATDYDTLYDDRDHIPAVVTFLRRHARPASVLELGVGTGRLALPLAAAGLRVVGVDNSPAMLDRLRAKPGADRVDARLGDMLHPPTAAAFGCVLIAFSTLYLLTDQTDQRACITAAAARLAPGGSLIVEGFIPDPDRWHHGHSLHVDQWDPERPTMSVGRLDTTAQTIETLRITHTDGQPRVVANRLRYVLPAELDLLAEAAGLALTGRYRDLTGHPFDPGAHTHVSVYSTHTPPG